MDIGNFVIFNTCHTRLSWTKSCFPEVPIKY